MNIIGRKEEQTSLNDILYSPRSEFLVVYGRRRVGKTYLIKEYFNNTFSFYSTGVAGSKTREQLSAFTMSLAEYGDTIKKLPANWFDAFSRLRALLESDSVVRDAASGRRVVFLDEVPWMDTARSDFKPALDFFWNSWASAQKDLLLIACGSATSWILDNLLKSTGGFYNRVTRQLHLMPFTLDECDRLYSSNGIVLNDGQIVENYMIFGGIPYYINLFDKRLSTAQNIDALLFRENGRLLYEYDRLFSSLFKHPGLHTAIIEALSESSQGITRAELAQNPAIGGGEPLTKALSELEQCGFIRHYHNFTKKKEGAFFQIIDPFILFSIRFIKDHKLTSWINFIDTPAYFSWCGSAFETVCLNHINEIKTCLGISGVECECFSWRSRKKQDGAQIDLVIDRKDGVINICEMKYTLREFVIDSTYSKQLRNKLECFREETKTTKALRLTMVTMNGLARNEYAGIVQNTITAADFLSKK